MLARRVGLGAAAVTLIVSASGCGSSNAGPSTLPKVNQSTFVSTAPPIIPPSGTANDSFDSERKESAEHFARSWHDEFNEAQATGDFGQVEQLSAPSCALCAEEIATIKRFLAQGKQIRGGQFEILSVSVAAYTSPSALVEVTSITSPAELIDQSGNVVQSFEATPPGTVLMNLLEQDGSWIVQDMIRN